MSHSGAVLAVVRGGYQRFAPTGSTRPTERLGDRLATPVSGASLAVVRVAYGLLCSVSALRSLAYGWVDALYAGPPRRFTFALLAWVPKPAPLLATSLLVVVAVAGIAVALGVGRRPALAALVIAFGWLEFVDVANYLNHYWFLTLLGVLLFAAPCTQEYARAAAHRPIAAGWVWLLRAQVAVVYGFAGLAKLNADWLFHALPLRLWLPARSDIAVIGPLLRHPETAFLLSWAGAFFDCTIVALLCWRRTRLPAWLAVVAFHLVTWRLFAIGIFPWAMIAAATLFFAPDWPHTLAARLRRHRPVRLPLVGAEPPASVLPTTAAGTVRRRLIVAGAVAWLVVQVALPLRHLALPGDARWTGEGYLLSWNVLRVERSGSVQFRLQLPDGSRDRTDAMALYTERQWATMASDPELIRQAAHQLAAEYGAGTEVRVDAFVSLNGRAPARLIDPEVDLAAEPWRWHQPWILPAPTTPPP